MKTKAQYEKEIIKCIEENNLFRINNIFSFYTGISKSQFHLLKLNKSDKILKALDDNKTKTCHSLLGKWYGSDNATLQVALYKVLCSDEDAARLNGSKQQIDTNITVTEMPTVNIKFRGKDDE